MPVLEPPPAPGKQDEPEHLLFAQIREQVRLQGNSEAVLLLRQDTRSRLALLQESWPSGWTYI